MKRLGEKTITAGSERRFAAALLLMYAYLFYRPINNTVWYKLLVVYLPFLAVLLLLALLPRLRSEKIELKLVLLFAVWVIFTRVLRWDVKSYIEYCRSNGLTLPADTLIMAGAAATYLPMAASLILRGRNRERFLDAVAIVTASFFTLTTTFALYSVLNKTDLRAPFGNFYLSIINSSRLYVFGKNPNACGMWYFLSLSFLAYLFTRTKKRLCRVLIVLAGLLNYVTLAMTFSRNAMLSFSLCTGLLVLVLVLRRFSPKTLGKKLLCTVLVLALIVPTAYKSFSLADAGMEKLSSVLAQKRYAAAETQAEDSSAEASDEDNTAEVLEESETEAPPSSPTAKDREGIEIIYEDNRGFGDSGRIPIYKTIIPTMQREPLRLLIGCLNNDAMKYTNEILGNEILNFHNTFLQVLCLTGVPGLLLVLALCVLLGRRVIRVIYSDAPVTISILALMLVGIFSYNMLEVNLFYIMDVSTFAAYTAAGAVLAHTYERDEGTKNPK